MPLAQGEGVGEAEKFAGFGRGNASVGGEFVEVVEARTGRPGGESRFAEMGEMFLKAGENLAGAGIARGNRAAGARVATLEGDFANGEADNAAFVFTKKAIFPEGGQRFAAGSAGLVDIDFKSGAKALASFLERYAREPLGTRGKPFADSAERGGRDDGGAVGDGVVRETVRGMANDDLLLEDDAEPFGGVFVGLGEDESARGDTAAITGNGKSDGAKVRGVVGANEMDGGSALAIHPLAVGGVESPGAVESESTGGADASLADGNGIEGLDGVETNKRKGRNTDLVRHEKSVSKTVARWQAGEKANATQGPLAFIAATSANYFAVPAPATSGRESRRLSLARSAGIPPETRRNGGHPA